MHDTVDCVSDADVAGRHWSPSLAMRALVSRFLPTTGSKMSPLRRHPPASFEEPLFNSVRGLERGALHSQLLVPGEGGS